MVNGRQSSLSQMSWNSVGGSMVSDYTLSYGTNAIEPHQLVKNLDGRFVPSYVALDRKVLKPTTQ